jgi:hypothetical protein
MCELAPVPRGVRDAMALVNAVRPASRRRGWATVQPSSVSARGTAGGVVGKEYVRATVAFLTNDSAARVRGGLVISEASVQYAGQPTNQPSSDPHQHRTTRCGRSMRVRVDLPLPAFEGSYR